MSFPKPAPQAASQQSAGGRIDWPQLLAEHERWLRTVIFARVGERQAVDEVFQEVSLAAVEQKAPLTDPTKAAPWLYRLAVTQSLLYRRKTGRRRKLVDRYANQLRPGGGDPATGDALGWLLADERRRLIREAMSRLSPRDSELLLLKYTEDWSYHQLAERLGIGHSAVEARLHRARGRLRNELTKLDVIETAG